MLDNKSVVLDVLRDLGVREATELRTGAADMDGTAIIAMERAVPEWDKQQDYPAYVQPAGAHDAYHKGDKISYNGKRYTCVAPDGVAVVWDPDTYPDYWEEVKV